jgi:methionine-S-sulfoxide reductase
MEDAFFALGCFWGPEARFASLDGVKKTAVGYAGGEKENPTYHDLGDHTETVRITYDPEEISFRELLEKFFDWHDFTEERKTQYRSIVFYRAEEERKTAEEVCPEAAVTTIRELEDFYIAEEYHQKYRLRNSRLMEGFEDLSPEEFIDSEEAAKANARAAGY